MFSTAQTASSFPATTTSMMNPRRAVDSSTQFMMLARLDCASHQVISFVFVGQEPFLIAAPVDLPSWHNHCNHPET
jgi:hypothetical protein